MTWRILLYFILINNIFAADEEKTKIVVLDEGTVVGTKYWDGDYYEFYGIPYAEVPTGRDRYQAPLPPIPWEGALAANVKNIVCNQAYYTEEEENGEEFIVSGDEGCLVINLFVPEVASKDNLLPVVVYVHSGAFSGGNGNMARFHYLARHDIIVISFNYRLGALGFACLGSKEIPGNAGLKDQVAALRWIKKYIKRFDGDPNKITLAGFSVGASMAELLTLSKTTDGLIDQLILDSASGLAPFTIDRDPVATAKNLALAMGYNGTNNLEDITEFYLNVSENVLAAKSINFFLPNSTFGFAPCIENYHKGIEPFLTESPLDILRKGKNSKIPVLLGFANMEGISRTIKFGEWREQMTQDFSKFLPADLAFKDDNTKTAVIKEIKKRYFKGDEVTHEKLQNYIDYFSDIMFKYSIMKSLKLRAAVSKRKMYLYEFNYLGKLNMQHNYMEKIKGASHRDQTAYILDFFGWTNSYKDLEMRDRMTIMWADFVKYGDPTAYESAVINYKWLPYTNENQNYLHINKKPTMKKNLFVDSYNFWDKIYKKYYSDPIAPVRPKDKRIQKNEPETEQPAQTDKKNDNKVTTNDKKDEIPQDNGTKDPEVVTEMKKEDTKIDKENLSVEETIQEKKETKKVNNVEQKVNTKDKIKQNDEKEKIKIKDLKIEPKRNPQVKKIKQKDNKVKQETTKNEKVAKESKNESDKDKQDTKTKQK